MNCAKISSVVLCLLGLLAPVAAGAIGSFGRCDFDDFPIMDEMTTAPLLGDALHNNRPMMVRTFLADASQQKVIDHYHAVWKGAFDDSAYGPWTQVSTLTKRCMMTVQIAPNGDKSMGRLVISNVPDARANAALGKGLIKPSDATVISDLQTRDGVKTGRVSVLSAADSPQALSAFYRNEYLNDGWKLAREFSEGAGVVLVFRRGLTTANILLLEAPQGSQVLINEEEID